MKRKKKFLNILNNDMERLIRLVNDLLDLSKIEAGKMELKGESANMGSIVREAVDAASIYADTKKVRINIDDGGSRPQLNLDKDRII